VLERLPGPLRQAIGVDDREAAKGRRLEIGCGPHPRPGYLHLDVDRRAHHLEWVARAWDLPLPDTWAREILSIHALEHVPPARLGYTLREWYRVLQPGGRVQIHVPNAPELMRAFLESKDPHAKWRLMGSILGMYCSPEAESPEALQSRSDHQILFDYDLLHWALSEAGFVDVIDLSDRVDDRHTLAWARVVPQYSLIVQAERPESAAATRAGPRAVTAEP
jgi:SAM-dependent methyltransferase